jgi:hypothetical protein
VQYLTTYFSYQIQTSRYDNKVIVTRSFTRVSECRHGTWMLKGGGAIATQGFGEFVHRNCTR